MALLDSPHNGDHARTFNLLDWITAPGKFSKGKNIETHIRNVTRFIEQTKIPSSYAVAILTNSLDEETQIQLFSHPEFHEGDDLEAIKSLLRKIYQESQTEISDLVTLLSERQDPTETVDNFLLRLRVRAYKIMSTEDRRKKEDLILCAFINGLRDKRIAKAVEVIKPDNTETAVIVARREEAKQCKNPERSCFMITEDTNTQKTLQEMSLQIKILSEQVTHLTNLIKRRPQMQQKTPERTQRTYAQVTRNIPPTFGREQVRNEMMCWNCNGTGHSWRNCWKKVVCKRCYSTDHVTKFCKGGEAVRYFETTETNDEEIDPWDGEENHTVVSEETEASTDCLTIRESGQKSSNNLENNAKFRKRQELRAQKDDHQNINEWVNFVNGKQEHRPKHVNRATTIISNSRSETAANKPLVRGTCEDVPTPILIDSGAALNVIDEQFVKQVGRCLKVEPESLTIRCANNGKVTSLGKVTMRVKIGGHEESMTFSIMPNLFPKVIIGLRQMKVSHIVIDPKADSIWIKQERIPFVSRTRMIKPGNQRQPFSRGNARL